MRRRGKDYQSKNPYLDTLRQARIKQGRTQTDVAVHIGSAPNSVVYWETDRAAPSIHNYIAWANALGYKVKLEKD